MIRTIVFDMDGVLIDTEALILEAWKEVAAGIGLKDIEKTLYQCIGITAPETEALFRRTYGEDFPYQKYKAMSSEIFHADIKEHGLPVKPGVYELFDFLKEKGWQIGLASSTRKSLVCEEMESIGLLNFFHVIVCGDMVTHSKPHPEIYLKACELLCRGGLPQRNPLRIQGRNEAPYGARPDCAGCGDKGPADRAVSESAGGPGLSAHRYPLNKFYALSKFML